jgi:hypothetical protein
MKLKSQTTVFIIVAIVIIAAIAGGAYTYTENKQSEAARSFFASSAVKPSLDNLQSQIQNCLETTSKDALETIGIQGGFYNKPSVSSNYFDIEWAFIPYYYNLGRIIQPSTQKIQTELAAYVENNLETCFDSMANEGFTINPSSPKTTTTINNNNVLFEVDSPIQITKEDHTITFETEDFPITINSKLKEILEVATFITQSHKQDPSMYCISCVGQMAEERDVYVDMVNFREDEMLVIISENVTSTEPYSFEFLNKYTGNEISPEIETTGTIPNPPAAA